MPQALPTPQQVQASWEPHLDSVTKLLGRIQPEKYPGALCTGKAPRFDWTRLEGESVTEFRERKQFIRLHCQRCPVVDCPARRVG